MAASTRNTTAGVSKGRLATTGRSGAIGNDGSGGAGTFAAASRGLLWMPVLFVGAGLYWSLALGLGGRSFELLAISDDQLEIAPEAPAEPIIVDLVSEAAADSLAGASDDRAQSGCGAEREPGTDDVRIGRTAF